MVYKGELILRVKDVPFCRHIDAPFESSNNQTLISLLSIYLLTNYERIRELESMIVP
ncbi:hypothetical protein [Salinibacillus kushneri]|uniref:hypothetical protein n=1 Tax=Salinibacillus kushneri TaxID=237682 RepID=UPI001FE13147|nr:hypothetical protein [Salinibacillus kushneri]